MTAPSVVRRPAPTKTVPGAAALALTLANASLYAWLVWPLVLGASTDLASAESRLKDWRRDDSLLHIPDDDEKMAAAMRKARATLEGFLALARKPKPSMSGFTVKVPLIAAGGHEYVWLYPFRVDRSERIVGVIGNTPIEAKQHRKGEILTFPQSAVVDWAYVDRGRMMGNFTTCVLVEREPAAEAEAFKAAEGLTCGP